MTASRQDAVSREAATALGLACPTCRTALDATADELRCRACGCSYSVVHGVPVLLPATLSGQQSSQTAYFDAEFSAYDTYDPENWRRSFIARIFSSLGVVESGGSYLDVGVGGSGATVIEAARLGVAAVGCDLSVAGVVQAGRAATSEGLSQRARFVACVAEALPFPDASFTTASAVAVLEHLDDDELAARELHRVLRPGGRVWITVPNAYRYIPPPLWPVYKAHDRRLGHKRHYDIAALAALMERIGFRHRETSFTGHPVKVLQLLVARLGSSARAERLWWKLESLDLRADKRALGALQLNAVFERPA